MPLRDKVAIVDVRTRPIEVKSSCTTSDMKDVDVVVRVLQRPDANEVYRYYKTLGDYGNKTIVPNFTNLAVIRAVADLKAQELMANRRDVSDNVTQSIKEKLASNYIIIDDLAVISIDFKKETAPEAKIEKQQDK